MDWDSGIDTIAGALGRIPWEVWHVDRAKLLESPSFQDIGDTPERYSPGAFITLMAVAGLNNYQTAGKAEDVYWPPLWKRVRGTNTPRDPLDLVVILEPLYGETIPYIHENTPKVVVRRLKKFLRSQLAHDLWSMEPEKVAEDLPDLWRRLDSAMNGFDSKPFMKTIVYATKTVASALIILGIDTFHYKGIPIPPDYRLGNLTCRLDKGDKGGRALSEIQRFWAEAIEKLRASEPRISAYHLDNLLWPYAGENDREGKLNWLSSQGIDRELGRHIIDAFEDIEWVEPR